MTAAPPRMLWLAAGSVLALVLAVSAGLSLVGWSAGSVERTEHHVLGGGVTQLRIDGGLADVTLTPTAGDRVVVDSRAKASLWMPEPRTRVDGNRVSLGGGCRVAVFGSCSASFVVRVPHGVGVSVATATGDVRADGLTGPLELHVSSGDVELSGLSGGTTAKVASGDIDASRLSGRVELETASGDVRATGLDSGVVNARASSGDVLVDLAAAPQRVNLASTSGDVTILVPRDRASYDTQLATSSGETDPGVPSDPNASRSLSAVTSSGDAAIRYR